MQEEKLTIWTKDFILICIATLFMSTAFFFFIPTLPVYITETIKAEKSITGIVLSSFTIAALIIRPFTGYFIDVYGRKWIYIIAFFFMAFLCNGYIFASSIFLVFLMRFLHGLAWGATTTAGSTIAVDMLPVSKRGEGIGIFGLSMPIAMSIGPLIGLSIVGHTDYTTLFIIGSLLCLAGFLLLLMIKFPVYIPPLEKKEFNFKNLIDPKSIPLSANILFITLPYGGIISFIAIYAKETGISDSGLFFLFFAIGIGIARIVAGKIFDVHGPRTIFSVGILLLISGMPLLALVHNLYGFLSAAFLLGIGHGIIFPVSQAMINNMVEIHQRGAANSTLFTSFDIGIGVGMALTGILADIITLSYTYLLYAGICIIGLLFAVAHVFSHYEKNKIVDEKM